MTPLEVFAPDANPLGAQWLSALVACLPIVAMLVTLGALRWKAHLAGLFSWLVAAGIAVVGFGMPLGTTLATSAHGFAYGIFPIVFILLTAIWMYEVTVASGRFDDLRRTFFLISDDPRVVGLLVAFCFGGLLEALAGYGAPVAITAAMLVAVGHSALRSALVALLANTVPVAFGVVGLPILMAARVGGFDDVLAVSPIAGRLTAILCLVVPFLLLAVMDGRSGVRECWPIGLVIGVTFGITKWIVSATQLFYLTEMFASVISVAVAIAFLRVWKPRGAAAAMARVAQPLDAAAERTSAPTADAADDGPALPPLRIMMALVPYAMVIVVFGIAAIPAVKAFLTGLEVSFAWPFLQDLANADGTPSAHRSFTLGWAASPGLHLAIVAVATGLVYRMTLREVFGVLWAQVTRMRFAALTIGFVVALAYVMGDSGQTLALGLFVAGAGIWYAALAPVLGWIGTYVTGSDTSANILFSGLQSSVGHEIGPGSHLGTDGMRALLVGAGATGGVVGKMISPQSLAIAATAISLPGSEALILRRVIGWSLGLLVLLCVLSGLMATPVLSWLLPQ
ncbi:L-lactate permease [Tessaracoccus terricola]